jgi:hypothetical protein
MSSVLSDDDKMSHDTLHTTDPGKPPASSTGGVTGSPANRTRKRIAALAAALALILIAAIVAIVATGDGDETSSREATTTTEIEESAEEPAPAPGPTAPAPETTAPPVGQASALDQLEPFLGAAGTMDDRLRAAAHAINGSGPPFTSVTDDVAAAVQAADPGAVAAEIPAGMPTDLLRQTILAYSDLASRRAAMASFGYAHEVPGAPTAGSSDDLVRELGNGHDAAQRFDDDLAALRAMASGAAPFTVAAPDSRAAAEVWIHVAAVDTANGGCDSRGGAVFTELLPVAWQSDTRGTVGDITFDATLANGRWDVRLNAC